MSGIEILFLSKEDIDVLDLGLKEVMDAIEAGLQAHGERAVIMPSKDHLALDYPEKLFNILKGYVAPIEVAGVKVSGDFQKNYEHNLPSELALMTLYRPETGAPFAISDIMLGHLAYQKALQRGIGTRLPYYRAPNRHVAVVPA